MLYPKPSQYVGRVWKAHGLWLPMAWAVCTFSISIEAQALDNDNLTLQLSETLTYDSNIFRISGNANPATAIGSEQRGDTYRTTTLGVDYVLPVGRQRFDVGYNKNDTRYENFTDLNYDGHDEHATWLWQLGDKLNGQIGYSDTLSLATFSNIQANIPNPVDQSRYYANANYLMGARWSWLASYARTELTNGSVELAATNLTTTDPELSVTYLTPAGSSIGIDLRLEDGIYPNRELATNNAFYNDYFQRDLGVQFSWLPTGHSSFSTRVGQVERDYQQAPQQNYEGSTYNVSYNWTPTGKLALSAAVYRQISAVQAIIATSALTKGITTQATWTPTAKLKAGATLTYSTQDYLGDITQISGSAPEHFSTKSTGCNLIYSPLTHLSITANFVHEKRTSNILFGDYLDNLSTLNAKLSF